MPSRGLIVVGRFLALKRITYHLTQLVPMQVSPYLRCIRANIHGIKTDGGSRFRAPMILSLNTRQK